MSQDVVENTAAPPAWWGNARFRIDRKMGSNAGDITNHVNRMFTLQSQRMDNIEQRPEANTGNFAGALKAVDTNASSNTR